MAAAFTPQVRWIDGVTGKFATVNGHWVTQCSFGIAVQKLGPDGLPAQWVGVFDDIPSAVAATGFQDGDSRRHSAKSGICPGCGNRLATGVYPDLDGLVIVGHSQARQDGGYGDWCDGSFLPAASM